MNAAAPPESDSDVEVQQPRALIGAIDVDASVLAQPAVNLSSRIVAALSYVGILSAAIAVSSPKVRFVRKHLQVAILVFSVRVLWTLAVVIGWWLTADPAAEESRLRGFLFDATATILIGLPVSDIWTSGALPWLIAPGLATVLTSILGIALAITGRSADVHAFTTADWSDPSVRRTYLGVTPEEERELARRARDRQLERLQKSSRMLRTEQARRLSISDVEAQLERIELQREYHDQLLSLGEISQRRYEQVNSDLDEQAERLRAQLSSLESRVQKAESGSSSTVGGSRLRRPAETLLESLAIVTPDGIPIFTYGQFQLDDAIVAGMLSAFDSLSEEVFGSRVSKTSLDGGQVLYFAHGDYVLLMASFIDEPSPRQVEDLRTMLKQFESANDGPIARKQYDPNYLHEVPVPFRFVERMPRSTSGSPGVA
ncbi:hypothetical protein BH23CHL2_BH23CHL2_22760 [soil metagenome]